MNGFRRNSREPGETIAVKTAKNPETHTKAPGGTPCATRFRAVRAEEVLDSSEDGSWLPLNFCRWYRSDNLSLDSRPAPDSRVTSTGSDLASVDSGRKYLRNTVSNRSPAVRADNASACRALCVPASAPLQILRGRQNGRTARQSHGPLRPVLMRSERESLSSAALFCLQNLSRARDWVFRSIM